MNFLLFRGTFFVYSQSRNIVEGSCKSLGQTPATLQNNLSYNKNGISMKEMRRRILCIP
jgi:hypothetical protein